MVKRKKKTPPIVEEAGERMGNIIPLDKKPLVDDTKYIKYLKKWKKW